MFRKKDKNQGIPDGVVGNNLKNARLTKKEREEIATTERKRIRKQMEAEAERYQIIKSTQRIIPVEDIFNGVIITKDHRYVKVMEYRPINFAYMDAETQNRVISLFYQTFKAVPCNIQFKTFARKADLCSGTACSSAFQDTGEGQRWQEARERSSRLSEVSNTSPERICRFYQQSGVLNRQQ